MLSYWYSWIQSQIGACVRLRTSLHPLQLILSRKSTSYASQCVNWLACCECLIGRLSQQMSQWGKKWQQFESAANHGKLKFGLQTAHQNPRCSTALTGKPTKASPIMANGRCPNITAAMPRALSWVLRTWKFQKACRNAAPSTTKITLISIYHWVSRF